MYVCMYVCMYACIYVYNISIIFLLGRMWVYSNSNYFAC